MRTSLFEAACAPEAQGPKVPQNTAIALLKNLRNLDSSNPLVRGESKNKDAPTLATGQAVTYAAILVGRAGKPAEAGSEALNKKQLKRQRQAESQSSAQKGDVWVKKARSEYSQYLRNAARTYINIPVDYY